MILARLPSRPSESIAPRPRRRRRRAEASSCVQASLRKRRSGAPSSDTGDDEYEEGIGAATADACRALAKLCQHEDAVLQLAGTADVMEVIVDVMVTATSTLSLDNSSTQMTTVTAASNAAQALAAVSVHDAALPCCIAAGGAPALVAQLRVGLRVLQSSPTATPLSVLQHVAAVSAADAGPRETADHADRSKAQHNLQTAVAAMDAHVAEAILSLSMTARGAAALFDAGAIPVLLQALTVASADAVGSAGGSLRRQLMLREAVCWALRGFARDREQLRVLAAAGAVETLTTLLVSCSGSGTAASTQPQVLSAGDAEAGAAERVADHTRTLLGALQAAFP